MMVSGFFNDLFSLLKFHTLIFKNKDKALDKFEEDKNAIFSTSLTALLPIITISFLFSIFLKPLLFVSIVSCILLIYHSIIMVIYNNRSYRGYKDRIEEEERLEREAMEEEFEERMKRIREWRSMIDELKRRRIEEELKQEQFKKQQYRESNRNTVDQNMINAMKLLGLEKGFTQKDVKSAYCILSKTHHPDVKGGSAENFKRLNKAYNYIMDRI